MKWSGRLDSEKKERIHQWVQDISFKEIESLSPPPSSLAFIGFASDEGVRRNQGRTGAKEGPFAIRQALSNLALHRKDLSIFDVGTIQCIDQDLEKAQHTMSEIVSSLTSKGIISIGLGGGHEIAWAHVLGLVKGLKLKQSIALINFDAHLDMRPLLHNNRGHSGSSFLQIKNYFEENALPFSYTCIGLQKEGNTSTLLKTAHDSKTFCLFADEFHSGGEKMAMQMIDHLISTHDHLYISICLDVFATAYAPGVSAPQPLGLTPWQVIPLLRRLAVSKKIRGIDVAELSPSLDLQGTTARLAASLLGDLINHLDYRENIE